MYKNTLTQFQIDQPTIIDLYLENKIPVDYECVFGWN